MIEIWVAIRQLMCLTNGRVVLSIRVLFLRMILFLRYLFSLFAKNSLKNTKPTPESIVFAVKHFTAVFQINDIVIFLEEVVRHGAGRLGKGLPKRGKANINFCKIRI